MRRFLHHLRLTVCLVLVAGAAVALADRGASAETVEALKDQFDHLRYTGEKMGDYYRLREKRTGEVDTTDGKPVTQWTTKPIGSNRTDFVWSRPGEPEPAGDKPVQVEEWAVRTNCAAGRDFVWLDAYRNDYPALDRHARFRIETTRAELRFGNRPWTDITDGGSCGRDGQPKALYDVPTTPYTLQVWGNIYKADGVTVGRRFYWRATMSYVGNVENPCWREETGRVRPAIKQEEAWWDSATGWSIGSGSMGADGAPDGERVSYTRWGLIGKGVGQGWGGGWKSAAGEARICLLKETPAPGSGEP